MTVKRTLRFLPAVPVCILAVTYVQSEIWRPVEVGYAELLPTGTSTVFLIAPFSSAWAAWRAGALRRGRVLQLAPARSHLRVAARTVEPVVAGTLTALMLAVVWGLAQTSHLEGATDVRHVATAAIVVTGHIVIGYAVGVRATPVVTVPALLVLVYVWMVFPPAWEPLWLRHLTGFVYSPTYPPGYEADPAVLVAPAVLIVAIAVSSLLLLEGPRVVIRRLAAGLLVVLGVTTSVLLVAHLGPDPVRIRGIDASICTAQQEPCSHQSAIDDGSHLDSSHQGWPDQPGPK